MKHRYFWLFAMLLVGFCGCEEDVSEPNSFDSILGSGDSKDNVIYYVTTDHQPLDSINERDFNATIFWHKYSQENGRGKIVFVEDVTVIGDYAFHKQRTLEKIIIPKSVVYVGIDAFYDCSNLKEVYCKPPVPPAIYYDGYYDDKNQHITCSGSFPFNLDMKIYVLDYAYDEYMQYSDYRGYRVDEINWSRYESYIEPFDFE